MKIRSLTILVLLFIIHPVLAQQTGIIAGTIQDINTGRALSGATITIIDLSISTQSDTSGRFRIALPVGTYKVSASNIGYVSQIKYNIVVGSGNPQLVNFSLET